VRATATSTRVSSLSYGRAFWTKPSAFSQRFGRGSIGPLCLVHVESQSVSFVFFLTIKTVDQNARLSQAFQSRTIRSREKGKKSVQEKVDENIIRWPDRYLPSTRDLGPFGSRCQITPLDRVQLRLDVRTVDQYKHTPMLSSTKQSFTARRTREEHRQVEIH
jgi:hypothetical protein